MFFCNSTGRKRTFAYGLHGKKELPYGTALDQTNYETVDI